MGLILLLTASFLLLMTTVGSDETIASTLHIISTVVKFVAACLLLASDWIIDHFPEVQGWVISHLYVAATVVGVVILVFVLVLRLGLAFVRCLGFGTKGVTKGSTAARYQSRRLGGSIPAGSMFSSFQSMGMTQR